MDIASNGVMEAKALIMVVLSLKRPDHKWWPNPRATTMINVSITDSFKVTNMAFLAPLTLPAPSSFDTLVLQK